MNSDALPVTEGLSAPFSCPVCGSSAFLQRRVLWPALIEAWGLNEEEVRLIDRQQGFCCSDCGCNLRSMTMAAAMLREFGRAPPFRDCVRQDVTVASLRVLEINAAGNLSPYFSQIEHYTLAQYPDIDMQAMPYADGSYDLIAHGDTLEHVPDPVRALSECRRVLCAGGKMLLTIPIVPSRLTRRTTGLPASYHGDPETSSDDYIVRTEYGADFYLDLLEAGFREVRLHTLDDAASFCIVCVKP